VNEVAPSPSPFPPSLLADYKRACVRVLEGHGIAPHPEGQRWRISAAEVIAIGIADGRTDRERFEIWTAESFLFALRSLEYGETVQAFRAYAQAREYIGRLGGRDPLALWDVGSAIERGISDAMRRGQ
jgi:hypothetical protein